MPYGSSSSLSNGFLLPVIVLLPIQASGFHGTAGFSWLKSSWPCLTSVVKSPNSSSWMVSRNASTWGVVLLVGWMSECMLAGIVLRRTGVGDNACVGTRGSKLNWSWVGDLTMVVGSSVRSNRSMLCDGWKEEVGRGFVVCVLVDVNATELDRLMSCCCFTGGDTFKWLTVALCCRGELWEEAVMGDVGAVLVVGDLGKLDLDKWGKNLDSEDRPKTDDLFSDVVY